MTGKAYEEDLIMAIENIGHEMKMTRERAYLDCGDIKTILEDIAGSLELIASRLGDQ
jgi:hypothetical protein